MEHVWKWKVKKNQLTVYVFGVWWHLALVFDGKQCRCLVFDCLDAVIFSLWCNSLYFYPKFQLSTLWQSTIDIFPYSIFPAIYFSPSDTSKYCAKVFFNDKKHFYRYRISLEWDRSSIFGFLMFKHCANSNATFSISWQKLSKKVFLIHISIKSTMQDIMSLLFTH